MKLVDKMILFSRFLRNNKDRKLKLDEQLTDHKLYFAEQSKYWRDKSLYNELDSALEDMHRINNEFNTKLDNVDKKIEELLRKEEITVLQRDYETYENNQPTLLLMQERAIDDRGVIKLISADIGYFSDWRWAGVELNPSTGLLTRSMLACDPLYLYTGNIVDEDNIKSKFNNFFADKRLMMYNDLDKLPQGQLGLATSINCYEFWPVDPIKNEMQKVYNLLHPGGHFIFTYNDCEKEASLDFLSGQVAYRSYNTRSLMTNLVKMLGFDIIKEQSFQESHTWMIVKKPGDLTSQKLSAPLVAIETPPTGAYQKQLEKEQ